MSLTSRFANLNDTTPAAPSGYQDSHWQIGATSGTEPTTGYPIYPVSSNVPFTGFAQVKTANYTATAADCGTILVFNSATAVTLNLPATIPTVTTATGTSAFNQWCIFVSNAGSGALTIHPNGLELDLLTTDLTPINQYQGLYIATDGTNYYSDRGMGGGGGGTWVYETPAGTLNGTNTTFTLSFTPTANSLTVYLNGVEQDQTRWASLSTATITFAVAPISIDFIKVKYQH